MDRNENGGTDGIRTRDHCIKSAMLYRLSYRPLELSRPMAEAWEEGPCPCPPPGGNPLPCQGILSAGRTRSSQGFPWRTRLVRKSAQYTPSAGFFHPCAPLPWGISPSGGKKRVRWPWPCRRVGAVRGFEASTLFPGPPPGRRGRTPASPRGRCRPVYPGGVPGQRGRVPIGRIRGGVPRRRRGGRRY